MIGAQKHKKNNVIPTLTPVACPACGKPRLNKEINEDGSVDTVSQETVEVRGTERYLEACGFCIIRYQKEDEKFVQQNLKKLSKAFNDDGRSNDGESDHRDFSLN